jgi:hypothetical protein
MGRHEGSELRAEKGTATIPAANEGVKIPNLPLFDQSKVGECRATRGLTLSRPVATVPPCFPSPIRAGRAVLCAGIAHCEPPCRPDPYAA